MAAIRITIATDNEAFQPSPLPETARILKELAERFSRVQTQIAYMEGYIRGFNQGYTDGQQKAPLTVPKGES